MKTKLFTLFIALVASTGILWASDTQVNGIWYDFDESNRTASVTYKGYDYYTYDNEYSGSITIPSSVVYNEVTYSVTSIGWDAFAGCFGLTSVTIGNSVTSIGNGAFYGCSGLTSVTIGNSVTSIGENAFENCSGLTSVEIPNSVTSIGRGAFNGCSGLTSVTIGNSVTSIGENAFGGCTGLMSVTIGNSVTSIGTYAFSGCIGLTSVTIPNSVTSIGNLAFAACDGLTSVNAPAIFFDILEEHWLYYAKVLQNVCVTADELNENELLFINRSYKSLKSIDLSAATNTELADEAFKGCYNLEMLKLPAGLTKISYMAVAGCKNLKSIDIPASVVEIEQSAFEDCRSIETITFGGVQPSPAPGRANAPAASTSQLQRIGNWAFYNAHELQHLTIPEGVTEIGDGAFYGCTYLEDLVLPSSVQSIGDNCFALCSKLTKITVNSTTPPTIEAKTFFDVKRQIPVYVPDNCVDAYKGDQYWGEFNIQGISEMPMAIDQTTSDQPLTTNKVLHNGQIFILRGDKIYTVARTPASCTQSMLTYRSYFEYILLDCDHRLF